MSPERRDLPLFFCFCIVHTLHGIDGGALVQKARRWDRFSCAFWTAERLVGEDVEDPSELGERCGEIEEQYLVLTLDERGGSWFEDEPDDDEGQLDTVGLVP